MRANSPKQRCPTQRYQRKRLAKRLASSVKSNNYFPQVVLRQLYFALIHSQLIYGLIIWGSTYFSYLKKLAVLQNRAILQVGLGGGNRYQRVTPFFVFLHELKLVDLFRLETAKFMLKFIHNKLPFLTISYKNLKYFLPNFKNFIS